MRIGLFRQKFGQKGQGLHMDFEAKYRYEKDTIATITK
jgi:hypothetical protein